jgi:hypothetical protein
MYKQLFILLFKLIAYPEKTWKALAEKQDTDNENFQKSYLYPVFGIIALLSFAGILLYTKEWNVQVALKVMIRELLSYFAGYFAAVFALPRLMKIFFKQEPKNALNERFIGYASAMIYACAMLYAVFPALAFIHLFSVYTFYMVWQGGIHYLSVKEEYLTKFTIFASILIVLFPFIVRLLLSLMMPGLGKITL